MSTHPPVFVVDDEDVVRSSLARFLRTLGVPSQTFASAEAFLAGLADREDGAEGCLLVDIRMPGMSGIDLLEELARRGIAMPAIVMTGHTDEASLQRLEALRTIGLLEKPFSVAQLKAMLARWRPPADDGARA
jgi:two-component system response regulator FixJ